jgi:hypothetical protein
MQHFGFTKERVVEVAKEQIARVMETSAPHVSSVEAKP